MVRLPFINITLPFQTEDIDSPDKKEARKPMEKFILHKNNVTAALLHMLDQAIELTLEINTSNAVLQQSGTTIGNSSTLDNLLPLTKEAFLTRSKFRYLKSPL